jgi:hypothetical protein
MEDRVDCMVDGIFEGIMDGVGCIVDGVDCGVDCIMDGVGYIVDGVDGAEDRIMVDGAVDGVEFLDGATNNSRHIYVGGHKHGFFSNILGVIGVLHMYDEGKYDSIHIDFQPENSLYYAPKKGKNWFEYFWYPIQLPSSKDVGTRGHVDINTCAPYAEFSKTREENAYIVLKYMKLKPPFVEEIDLFTRIYFKKITIGVHYRGTDKISEATSIAYDAITNRINAYIMAHNIKDFSIFIATDTASFIDYMKSKFSSICTYNSIRSIDNLPIHYNNADTYRIGNDVLCESYLLSRTTVLFRCSSNVSLFSTYLNLHLPVIELTTRR